MNKFTALFLGCASISCFAEEVDRFKADLELGAISTSGNTETSTFKGKADVRQDLRKLRNQFILEALFNQVVQIEENDAGNIERDKQTTGERYFASAQSDYKLGEEHKGLFLFGSYENDRFSGFEYQSTIAAGYSDRLIDGERSTFDFSVGPGVAISKEDEAEDEVTSGVVRLAFDYAFQISETAKFTQTFASDVSAETEKNSRTRAETALSANINSSMAMKFSYLIDHNTHVPDDKKHADKQAAVTLVFSL